MPCGWWNLSVLVQRARRRFAKVVAADAARTEAVELLVKEGRVRSAGSLHMSRRHQGPQDQVGGAS